MGECAAPVSDVRTDRTGLREGGRAIGVTKGRHEALVALALVPMLVVLGGRALYRHQAWQARAHDLRVELYHLVGRLADAPRAYLECAVLHGEGTDAYRRARERLELHHRRDAEGAFRVMSSIPDRVVMHEYRTLLDAFAYQGRDDRCLAVADNAVGAAWRPSDFAFAYPARARIKFRIGDLAGGRSDFEEGMSRISATPTCERDARLLFRIEVRLAWAGEEHEVGNGAAARRHITAAEQDLREMSDDVRRDVAAAAIRRCREQCLADG